MGERARWLTDAIDGVRRVFSQPPAPFRHAGERLTPMPFSKIFDRQFLPIRVAVNHGAQGTKRPRQSDLSARTGFERLRARHVSASFTELLGGTSFGSVEWGVGVFDAVLVVAEELVESCLALGAWAAGSFGAGF